MTDLRRKDRQVTQFEDIYDFLKSNSTLRLGIYADEYPYIVPLSYGVETDNKSFVFYVHSATSGRKVDLLNANPNVCAEVDDNNGYIMLSDGVTADYQSFIGFGKAELCEGEDKIKGLDLIMKYCGFNGFPDGKCDLINVTNVYKIIIDNYTCKKRFISKGAAE